MPTSNATDVRAKLKPNSAWKTAVPLAFITLTVTYFVASLAVYYYQSPNASDGAIASEQNDLKTLADEPVTDAPVTDTAAVDTAGVAASLVEKIVDTPTTGEDAPVINASVDDQALDDAAVDAAAISLVDTDSTTREDDPDHDSRQSVQASHSDYRNTTVADARSNDADRINELPPMETASSAALAQRTDDPIDDEVQTDSTNAITDFTDAVPESTESVSADTIATTRETDAEAAEDTNGNANDNVDMTPTNVASSLTEIGNAEVERIETLLAQAERLFDADALTTPVDNNALDKWRSVLSLEESHPVAVDGIQRILDRYLKLGAKAERAGEYDKAREFYARAEQAVPESTEVAMRQDLLRDRVRRLSNN